MIIELPQVVGFQVDTTAGCQDSETASTMSLMSGDILSEQNFESPCSQPEYPDGISDLDRESTASRLEDKTSEDDKQPGPQSASTCAQDTHIAQFMKVFRQEAARFSNQLGLGPLCVSTQNIVEILKRREFPFDSSTSESAPQNSDGKSKNEKQTSESSQKADATVFHSLFIDEARFYRAQGTNEAQPGPRSPVGEYLEKPHGFLLYRSFSNERLLFHPTGKGNDGARGIAAMNNNPWVMFTDTKMSIFNNCEATKSSNTTNDVPNASYQGNPSPKGEADIDDIRKEFFGSHGGSDWMNSNPDGMADTSLMHTVEEMQSEVFKRSLF